MNGPRLILVVVAGFVAALAFGGCLGCGGDSSPEISISVPTETQAASSSAEFIDQADAICSAANDDIGTFIEEGQGLTGAGEIADIRQGVAINIKDLGVPAEDRATAEQVIDGYTAQAEAGNKIALATDRGEDTTSAEAELTSAKADTLQAAESYGFKDCGQEPDASSSSSTGGSSVSPSAPVTPAPAPAPAPAPVTPPSTGGGAGGGVTPG